MNTHYNNSYQSYINYSNNIILGMKVIDLHCYETLDDEPMDNEATPSPSPSNTNISTYNNITTNARLNNWDPKTKGIDLHCYETLDDKPTDIETTPTTNDVKIVNLKELTTFFRQNVWECASLKERLEKLKTFFTVIPCQKVYWNLWLEIPSSSGTPICVDIMIEEGEYDSQCFPQKAIDSNPPASSLYIKAMEENNLNNFYFQLRIDPSATEILHIQNGAELSGNEVKKLCMKFLDYVRPPITFLHDDAKKQDENSCMYLRVFLPIVNEFPGTWYSKDGFGLLEYRELIDPEGNPRMPQNLQTYYQAIYTVRNTLLKDLLPQVRPLFAFPEEIKLNRWINFYLNKVQFVQIKQKNIWNCSVHELAKKMYDTSRCENIAIANKAKKDFQEFYRYFLSDIQQFFPVNYQSSLTVLHGYQLWFRYN